MTAAASRTTAEPLEPAAPTPSVVAPASAWIRMHSFLDGRIWRLRERPELARHLRLAR